MRNGLLIVNSTVVNFCLSGKVIDVRGITIQTKMKVLGPGDKYYVYPGLRHQMQAREDTELFEFSTQHFDSDSNRIEPGD